MIVSLIYKEYLTKAGNTSDIELIECDENRVSAAKFAKLYNLQLPKDLRNTVVYKSLDLRIYDKYSKDTGKYDNLYNYDAEPINLAGIDIAQGNGINAGDVFIWPPPPAPAPAVPAIPDPLRGLRRGVVAARPPVVAAPIAAADNNNEPLVDYEEDLPF